MANLHKFMEDAKEVVSELLFAVQDPSKKFSKDQQIIVTNKATNILSLLGHLAIEMSEDKNKTEIANRDKTYDYPQNKQKNLKNKYCVMISPKTNNDTSDSILKKIQKQIKISKLGICIEGIKKISRNRIIMECLKKEDAEKLQMEISKVINDVDTKKLSKKKPTLIFKGIFNDFDKEDFISDIIEQNEEIKIMSENKEHKPVFNVKKIIKNKFNDSSNYVVEVDSETRRILINKEKVKVGYQRIFVEDAIPVMQCYHCLRFGHGTARCLQREKDEKPVCSYCGLDHTHSVCGNKDKQPNCKNCCIQNEKYKLTFPVNHRANDKNNCKVYKKMLAIAEQNIEY